MENIKERIEDLVYGEIQDTKEKQTILSAIEKDPVLKEFYEQIIKTKESINTLYKETSNDLLERNREKLFKKINKNESVSKKIEFNEIFRIGRPLLKYAAVILLTFYATMYHFGTDVQTDDPVSIQSGMDRSNFRTVSTDQPSFANQFEEGQYLVDDLKIDDDGENITIDFNVSTNKTIKGRKNDPNIINALKYLIAHESNPGVKLRTLKAMDMGGKDKYKDALITTILNDENAYVRRKAIKMISNNSSDDKVRDALYQVVLNDKDQTNRIEALNILETTNGEYADKALRSISDEDNE